MGGWGAAREPTRVDRARSVGRGRRGGGVGQRKASTHQLVHLLRLLLLLDHFRRVLGQVERLREVLGVLRRLADERVEVLRLHRLELAQRRAVRLDRRAHQRGLRHAAPHHRLAGALGALQPEPQLVAEVGSDALLLGHDRVGDVGVELDAQVQQRLLHRVEVADLGQRRLLVRQRVHATQQPVVRENLAQQEAVGHVDLERADRLRELQLVVDP